MTDIDIAHLRTLAETALSKGPWSLEEHTNAVIIAGTTLAVAEEVYLTEDRQYLAAVDPQTVLALLARIDELEEDAKENEQQLIERDREIEELDDALREIQEADND